MWVLSDPGICRFLGPPLFPAAHAGLSGGIRFRPLSWSRILGLEPETDTQPPLCFLDRVARVRRKLNSLVLNSVSGGGRLPTDSAFRQLPIRNPWGGCLCYPSMLSGYTSEVAVMHWIGRRATGNNEHVWYTVPFLIGLSLYFGVAPSPRMERATLGRPEDKLSRLLPG